MRKKVFGRQLGRDRGSRKALRRSLIRALVLFGKIKTTRAKAKAIQPEIDKLMTLVRKNTLSSRRLILSKLGGDGKITRELFEKMKDLTKTRQSGFTRIIHLGQRKGDRTEMVQLEWVKNENTPTKSKRN